MTVGTFFYHVVLPAERTNLEDNPSFELGTAGYSGTASATLGTSAASQAFGVWALTATGASDGVGITTTTPSLGNGSAVTASAYVRVTGVSGGSAQIGLGGTAFRTPVGSAWQRIAVGTTQTSTTTRTLAVQRFGNVGASGTLWVDGVQVEYSSVTTYLDGDQEGCSWLGAPHASQSYRSAQTRAGGSVVPLAALGLRVETHAGVGMPPVANLYQSRAVLDGGEYQRTRADVREFTLTATMTGTTVADLHQTRRRVIDALKVDRTTPQAPTRFLYTGAGAGTVQIDAAYAGGLDITDMQVINDNVAARFTAFEPLWRSTLDEGTALAANVSLGSVNSAAYRDPLGRWGTMGANGSALQVAGNVPNVYVVNAQKPGTVFYGGDFGTVGSGTASNGVALWTAAGWGTMGGGVNAGGAVYTAAWLGGFSTLVLGGALTSIGGTTAASRAGIWTGAFGTLTGGTLSGFLNGVFAFAQAPDGALVVGGDFATAAGTISPGIARWLGAAWGTLVGGTIGQRVYAMASLPGGNLAVGGLFTLAGGTAVANFALYDFQNSRWGTYGVDIGTFVQLAATPSADLYGFGSVVSRLRAGGAAQLANVSATGGAPPRGLFVSPDGDLYVGRVTSIYNGTAPIGFAQYNGYSWVAPDLRVNPAVETDRRRVDAFGLSPDGTLYIGGGFNGPGTAAAVGQVVNDGMADAYPVLRIRNTGAGTVRVWQLLNQTTGDALYFNLIAAPGEYMTLDLTPGNRAFTSTARGNLISTIIGGSNLATWRLQPGTNWLSFFADSADVRADLFWRNRHHSVDGGAEPTI